MNSNVLSGLIYWKVSSFQPRTMRLSCLLSKESANVQITPLLLCVCVCVCVRACVCVCWIALIHNKNWIKGEDKEKDITLITNRVILNQLASVTGNFLLLSRLLVSPTRAIYSVTNAA